MNEDDETIVEQDYNEILLQAVAVIEQSRKMLATQVSSITTNCYWGIGKLLQERKLESKHGEAVVKRLSADLKQRYPQMGMSPRQLWNMKAFYLRYKDCDSKLLQTVAVLPWSHNLLFINKHLSDDQTLFYAQETINKGWNRDLLLNAIKINSFDNRKSLTDNNFNSTLPAHRAQYANNVFKDEYNLGFLGISEPVADYKLILPKEELQKAISDEISSFEAENNIPR